MVWRYEKATIARRAAITRLIGIAYATACAPAATRVTMMKSVAYATDESASDDSTARPVTRDRRSCCACEDGIRFPTRSRFMLGPPDSLGWAAGEAPADE